MAQHVDWSEVESLDPARAESPLDLLGILWRRKWIVACVVIIAAALGYLYYLQATRVYRSWAQVLLIKREANVAVAPGGGRDRSGYGYEDTLSTHMLLICSPLIVQKAVEKHHLASLSSLKGHGDAVSAVIAGLKATRAGDRSTPDPNVVDLWYEGIDPRECATILNAVIQSYQDFLGDTFQNFSEETLQLISQAKDVLNKQLTEKEAAYRQFRQDSPLLWRGAESANLHESRMAEIERARAGVLVENAQTKARIDAIRAAIKQGGSREALSMLATKTQSDSWKGARGARDSFEEKLFLSMLEEQQLMGEYGPDHPKVKAIEKRMNMMREHLGNMPLPEGADSSDFLGVYLESLTKELEVGEKKLEELNGRFEEERKHAKQLASFQVQDEQFRSEITRTQQMFDAVIKRLEEINLVKDYGGVSTQLISPPCVGVIVRPKLALVLALAGVLGMILGMGLGYLVDIADKSFRSPEEIRRQLGLPVIGHIPVIEAPRRKTADAEGESAANAISSILCTFHQPKSRPAEAYRAVRTSLYFSTHGEGHKVIQITSPNPGDGKTTLAANLAVSMADSGKRVLLLEADFRRPRVHKFFGLDNTLGVSSIIAGEAEIPDVIQQTAVSNLWAMPCGPRPHNPSDLLTSPRFKELIDTLRDQHDFVIVDTPPILAVTDSSVVAPRVDAVLLVVRLTKHARDGAMRATEMLGALGARILGVVVNGIGKTSGYGYGRYRYGYGGYGYRYAGGGRYGYRYSSGYGYSSSGYGYGYGYGSSEGGASGQGAYYSEEEPQAAPAKNRGVDK